MRDLRSPFFSVLIFAHFLPSLPQKATDLSGRAATVNVPLETLMQILQQQQQNGQARELIIYTHNFLPFSCRPIVSSSDDVHSCVNHGVGCGHAQSSPYARNAAGTPRQLPPSTESQHNGAAPTRRWGTHFPRGSQVSKRGEVWTASKVGAGTTPPVAYAPQSCT
jgi:hypothetical protein